MIEVVSEQVDFKELLVGSPVELSCVMVYDKEKSVHREKKIYRRYNSFGASPKLDPSVKKSYMISGSKGVENLGNDVTNLHPKVQKIIKDTFNSNEGYNQCVVNWYLSGEEFIEPHSDCDAKMVPDYDILIYNFCNKEGEDRQLTLTHRVSGEKIVIPLYHKTVVKLSKDMNTSYRHEVKPSPNKNSKRVSLTFRKMVV